MCFQVRFVQGASGALAHRECAVGGVEDSGETGQRRKRGGEKALALWECNKLEMKEARDERHSSLGTHAWTSGN